MDATIRRTTVEPTEGGSAVHVHISDAPLGEPFEAIELQMTVSLPEFEDGVLLAQMQREALLAAREVLSGHLEALAKEIHYTAGNLRPKVKGG
jgi:hypothetical protein